MIDEETVELMHKLYLKGWYVRVWKPWVSGCWAELVDDVGEPEGHN